jgi:hypothetical protein
MDGTNGNIESLEEAMFAWQQANAEKKEKSEIKRRKQNPFLAQMQIETKRKKQNGAVSTQQWFDDDGSVVATEINRVEWVDKEQFIKIFAKWLPIFWKFSSGGFKVWSFIASTLEPGKIEVRLHYKDAMRCVSASNLKGEDTTISKDSFYRGIKNLTELGLIAKQEDAGREHFYWINPSAFFNGDRVKFAVTYAKKAMKDGIDGEAPRVVRPTTQKSQASNFSSKRDAWLCATEEEALEAGFADMKEAS